MSVLMIFQRLELGFMLVLAFDCRFIVAFLLSDSLKNYFVYVPAVLFNYNFFFSLNIN
jgi:hypothetical protein